MILYKEKMKIKSLQQSKEIKNFVRVYDIYIFSFRFALFYFETGVC